MPTEQMNFDQLISKLSNNQNVDALLLCGSTATQTRTTSSDYDLVVIVKDKPEKLVSMFATIGNVPADIFFFTILEIETILKNMSVKDGAEMWLLNWLETGKISFDKSGTLTKLQETRRSVQKPDNVSLAKSYEYKINYNLLANTRYFESKDELYHAALEIRLLYSIVEALVGYFTMRAINWEGEKSAILYLRKNDPAYLKVFESVCRETSLFSKFASYKKLVEESFYGKYKKWDNDIAVSMDGDFGEFWRGLLNM
ncbi:MAG: nucleotidyltransferase domain-containing protein [Candidatus Taylorbacteria bacterium]